MLKIKDLILAATASTLIMLGFLPAQSFALDCTQPNLTPKEAVQCGACDAAGQDPTNCNPPGQAAQSLTATIADAINLISLLVGIVAVIMIVVAGFRYVTSAGNEQAVEGAKKTLLFAIIGLFIVALAQAIVRFVLQRTTTV